METAALDCPLPALIEAFMFEATLVRDLFTPAVVASLDRRLALAAELPLSFPAAAKFVDWDVAVMVLFAPRCAALLLFKWEDAEALFEVRCEEALSAVMVFPEALPRCAPETPRRCAAAALLDLMFEVADSDVADSAEIRPAPVRLAR